MVHEIQFPWLLWSIYREQLQHRIPLASKWFACDLLHSPNILWLILGYGRIEYPDEESLVVVVEDSSSFGPEIASIRSLEMSISLLEQEMICDQFLLSFLRHSIKRIVRSLQSIIISTVSFHLQYTFRSFSLNPANASFTFPSIAR